MTTLIPDLERDLRDAATRQATATARPRRRRVRFPRRGTLALVAAIAVAGGAAAAVVTTRDSTDPRIKAEIGILRRAVTERDRLPARFIRTEREIRRAGFIRSVPGLRYKEARRVHGSLGGWKAWVVPNADGEACLVTQEPSPKVAGPGTAGCFRLADIERGGSRPATGGLVGGGVYAEGIFPDGVTHVTVTRSDKTTFDVPVHDNAYIAVSRSHSTRYVSYDTAHGRVNVAAYSPGYIPPPPKITAEQKAESDKAKEDPSKRRPVHAGPVSQPLSGPTEVGGPRVQYYVSWRARITGGEYALRIRGPEGRECARREWLGPVRLKRSRRGHILGLNLEPPGEIWRRGYVTDAPTKRAWCKGTYKVDVAWVGNRKRHPPFGTATFIVR